MLNCIASHHYHGPWLTACPTLTTTASEEHHTQTHSTVTIKVLPNYRRQPQTQNGQHLFKYYDEECRLNIYSYCRPIQLIFKIRRKQI